MESWEGRAVVVREVIPSRISKDMPAVLTGAAAAAAPLAALLLPNAPPLLLAAPKGMGAAGKSSPPAEPAPPAPMSLLTVTSNNTEPLALSKTVSLRHSTAALALVMVKDSSGGLAGD